jgi:hypothetical protein
MLAQIIEQSESLSTKKIAIIVAVIFVGLIVFYYVGGMYNTTSTHTPRGKVVIRYSDTITNYIVSRVLGEYSEPGQLFLVLDLDIENQGYASISTAASLFSVILNDVEYSQRVTGVEDTLKLVDLFDGERIIGKVVFKVPQEVKSVGYQPRYQDPIIDNVKWIKE